MVSKVGAVAYVECSAKENKGVKEVFELAGHEALNYKGKGGGCCQLM